jgi:ATP-dependent DNA helicase RecQ
MMQRYLETDQCRWRMILGYFGEPTEEDCGHCDNCDARTATPVPAADAPFPLGARVVHTTFGSGEVVSYDGDTMTLLFEDAGYRNLSVALVVENDLLSPG